MNASPVVLHTIHSLHADAGGPSRTVPSLCEGIARSGRFRVVLLTTSNPGRANLLPDPSLVTSIEVAIPPETGPFRAKALFEQAVASTCRRYDVRLIHDHGQWLPTNRASAAIARRLGIPRVVSPRGMLSPWALSYRRFRKRVAWLLYAGRDLKAADAVHATSELERSELQRLGVRRPIIVIPNGLAGMDPASIGPAERSEDLALFLSRLHPKKGLAELIEAWSRVRPKSWRLVIAGPDEGGYRARLEQAVRDAGLNDEVSFVGPVEGEEKRSLLERASLFVLPSHSENFGIAVAEALAAEIPVITTRATPWDLLVDERCGWWTAVGVDPLVEALDEACRLSSQERREMGRRGRAAVLDRFDPTSVGAAMAEAYERLLLDRRPAVTGSVRLANGRGRE